MSTFGATLVSRNDNYGGNLKERAIYAINSCIETYDEVVYVDYNSRDKTLIEEIQDNLIKKGNLLVIKVTSEQHKEITKNYESPQPCSEVLGRNIGLRRLSTDFMVSTNVDNIQPDRNYLNGFIDINTMSTVARRGISLSKIQEIASPTEVKKLRDTLIQLELNQSWAVTREPWSLVEWCGDFQIAHKDLWYAIRGFDEWQLGVGVHDSYALRKAKELGYTISPNYICPLWHIDHNKSNDYGESGLANSTECLYESFRGIVNPETWGYSDIDFQTFRL